MASTYPPQPPIFICKGPIDDKANQAIENCLSKLDATSIQAMGCSCGYWILWKQKCLMAEADVDEYGNCNGSNQSAIIREEVARGRISEIAAEGVRRLVPNMIDERKDDRPYPTVQWPVTWILGGVYIHYTTGSQKYWECGDYFQAPNMNLRPTGTDANGNPIYEPYPDAADESNRNDFIEWYIMLYWPDTTNKQDGSNPFLVDDYSTHPWPVKCPSRPTVVDPGTISFTCGCDGAYLDEDENGNTIIIANGGGRSECQQIFTITEGDEAALVQAMWECNRLFSDPETRKDCECDPEPVFPPPPQPPPPPSTPTIPGGGGSGGGGGAWDKPPGGGISVPGWGGGWSSGGGGSGGGGGGWGEPPGGGGGLPVPGRPVFPGCRITIRTECPKTEEQKLREVSDDVQVPYKKQKLDIRREEDTNGLKDATYYVVKSFTNKI